MYGIYLCIYCIWKIVENIDEFRLFGGEESGE